MARAPSIPVPAVSIRDPGRETREAPASAALAADEAPLAEPVRPGPWAHRSRWLREARRPEPLRKHPGAHWWAVAAVCVGAFMGQLDASIVTVAFPDLEHAFHAPLPEVTWVGLGYLLVLVSLVTAAGRFSDMVGRKMVYVYGFAVFVLGSALCAAAPSLVTLVGARVLQAVGAAMLQANSVAIITLSTPRRQLGRALGLQGAAQALGLALGPSIGGLLLAAGGWRLIFAVNVPFGLLGLVAGLVFIPRSRHLAPWSGWRGFDWPGVALLLPAVACLLWAVTSSGTAGWGSPGVLGLLVGAIVVGAGFVVHERRVTSPLVDVRLFLRRSFSLAVGSSLLSYLVAFGTLLVVPFFLERAHGMGSARAGLELMVMPLALGLVAPFAGRWADRAGPRAPAVIGLGLVAAALALTAVLVPAPWALAVLLAAIGGGLGLFTAPNNASIMRSVERRSAAAVSGIVNMTRGVGTALGLALTGFVFAHFGGAGHAPAGVTDGFTAAAVMLCLAAIVAALLSSFRGRPPAARNRRAGGAA